MTKYQNQFNSLLKIYDIKQIYISKSIINNKISILNDINLSEYEYFDKEKPLIILGLYLNYDLELIMLHEGPKFIYWAGNDANLERLNLLKNKLNNIVMHLCIDSQISNNLNNYFHNVTNLNDEMFNYDIRIFGLRRSGNHFLINTLLGSFEINSTFFFNDVEEFNYERYNFPKDILDWGNLYSNFKLGEKNECKVNEILLEKNKLNIHNSHERIIDSKFSNNLVTKDDYSNKNILGKNIIQTYEDKSLNIINKINTQNIRSLKKINIIILRNPIDLLVSRYISLNINKINNITVNKDVISTLIEYYDEYLNISNKLGDNKIFIFYEKFRDDLDYRKDIFKKLNLNLNEDKNFIPKFGEGNTNNKNKYEIFKIQNDLDFINLLSNYNFYNKATQIYKKLNFHTFKKLDAVVIPITENEIEKLLINFKILINDKIPCSSKFSYLHLVFNRISDISKFDIIKNKFNEMNLNKYFIDIRITNYNLLLEDDIYCKIPGETNNKGPNIVFFNWNLSFFKEFNYRYVFQMETDIFPIKSYWLDDLNNEIINNNNFFRLGSYPYIDLPTNKFHINGNAVYNIYDMESLKLTKDSYKFIRDFNNDSQEKGREQWAFDNGLYQFLQSDYKLFIKYAKYLQYSNLIANYAGTKVKISDVLEVNKDIILIHANELL